MRQNRYNECAEKGAIPPSSRPHVHKRQQNKMNDNKTHALIPSRMEAGVYLCSSIHASFRMPCKRTRLAHDIIKEDEFQTGCVFVYGCLCASCVCMSCGDSHHDKDGCAQFDSAANLSQAPPIGWCATIDRGPAGATIRMGEHMR